MHTDETSGRNPNIFRKLSGYVSYFFWKISGLVFSGNVPNISVVKDFFQTFSGILPNTSGKVPIMFRTCSVTLPDLFRKFTGFFPDMFRKCSAKNPDMFRMCSGCFPDLFKNCMHRKACMHTDETSRNTIIWKKTEIPEELQICLENIQTQI